MLADLPGAAARAASGAGRRAWTRSARSPRCSSRAGSNGAGARTGWRSTSTRCHGSTTTASGSSRGPLPRHVARRRARRRPGDRPLAGGEAGLYDVGVEPGTRRSGLGRALTVAALRRGARARARRVATVNATEDGRAAVPRRRRAARWATGRRSGSTATASRLAVPPELVAAAEAAGRGQTPGTASRGASRPVPGNGLGLAHVARARRARRDRAPARRAAARRSTRSSPTSIDGAAGLPRRRRDRRADRATRRRRCCTRRSGSRDLDAPARRAGGGRRHRAPATARSAPRRSSGRSTCDNPEAAELLASRP